MTWRQWQPGTPGDSLLTVLTYETPEGQPCDPKHSRAVRIQHVTMDAAKRMLRTGASD